MQSGAQIFWNEEKNQKLRAGRGVGFEDVVQAMENGRILADFEHPQSGRRANQRVLVVEILGYACAVPYVEDTGTVFFKTLYHSRAYQKQYGLKP